MESKNFYFKGKFFDTQEEMFAYAKEWVTFKLTPEEAERMLALLTRDMVMNIFLTGKELTNGEFSAFMEKIFEYFINNLKSKSLFYSLPKMIEMAKNSEYGAVWYSDRGPIQITKEGTLVPL